MTQPIASGMPEPITFVPPEPQLFVPPPPDIIPLLDPIVGGKNPDVTGNNAYFNNLSLTNPSTISGGGVNSNLIPVPPSTLDLGSTTNHWRNLYVDQIIPTPPLTFQQISVGTLVPITQNVFTLITGTTLTLVAGAYLLIAEIQFSTVAGAVYNVQIGGAATILQLLGSSIPTPTGAQGTIAISFINPSVGAGTYSLYGFSNVTGVSALGRWSALKIA